MKKYLIVLIFIFPGAELFAFGPIGHRVVGQIAWEHMSERARENLVKLLKDESLAMIGTYMDEIRSEPKYDSLKYLHYCTIPDGKSYEEAGTPKQGDVIFGINKYLSDLRSGKLNKEQEVFTLKCLVHLIADVHQPLHVGNGEDRGGNDVQVTYFWQSSNLHRVWDEGIIEQQKLSYTEYAKWIDHPTEKQVKAWQQDDLMVWVSESIAMRPGVYSLPEDRKINYEYNYYNIKALNQRLLQAGIRLAGILNDIYGN